MQINVCFHVFQKVFLCNKCYAISNTMAPKSIGTYKKNKCLMHSIENICKKYYKTFLRAIALVFCGIFATVF